MDGDIEELFESLIKKYREQDAAFDELKLMMDEDEELKKSYDGVLLWDVPRKKVLEYFIKNI